MLPTSRVAQKYLRLLPGVRYKALDSRFRGNEILLDSCGSDNDTLLPLLRKQESRVAQKYLRLLPGVRYRALDSRESGNEILLHSWGSDNDTLLPLLRKQESRVGCPTSGTAAHAWDVSRFSHSWY